MFKVSQALSKSSYQRAECEVFTLTTKWKSASGIATRLFFQKKLSLNAEVWEGVKAQLEEHGVLLGFGPNQEVDAIELPGHPFFVGVQHSENQCVHSKIQLK